MSAFLCGAAHIGAIVAWYADHPPPAMVRRGGKVDRAAMAQALAMCNLHSLGFRYQDCPGRPDDRYKKPFDHMSEDNADGVVREWAPEYSNALAFVAACVLEAKGGAALRETLWGDREALQPADIVNMAKCLRYQCCEHPEFDRDGAATIERIIERASLLDDGQTEAEVNWAYQC